MFIKFVFLTQNRRAILFSAPVLSLINRFSHSKDLMPMQPDYKLLEHTQAEVTKSY